MGCCFPSVTSTKGLRIRTRVRECGSGLQICETFVNCKKLQEEMEQGKKKHGKKMPGTFIDSAVSCKYFTEKPEDSAISKDWFCGAIDMRIRAKDLPAVKLKQAAGKPQLRIINTGITIPGSKTISEIAAVSS